VFASLLNFFSQIYVPKQSGVFRRPEIMPLISKYLSLIFSVPPIGVRRFWPYHLHPRKEWVRGSEGLLYSVVPTTIIRYLQVAMYRFQTVQYVSIKVMSPPSDEPSDPEFILR